MSNNALRQGFRDILDDPALLLIEIAWRWLFGAVAIFIVAISIFSSVGTIRLDQRSFGLLARLSLLEAAEVIFTAVRTVAGALARVVPMAILALTFFWIIIATVGRHATLTRPALSPGMGLRGCLGLSCLRAGFSLIAIIFGIGITVLAGWLAAITSTGGLPNLALLALILFPGLAVVGVIWTAGNWCLSIAYLFPGRNSRLRVAKAWHFARERKDEILEISLVIGILRAVLMVFAFLLTVAVAAVVGNPRVALADIIAISLLYFLASDFLYIARLASSARLRNGKNPVEETVTRMDEVLP
jgi:hypothetical protein